MSDRRYDAMRHAVALALSGRFNNWWTISACLRAKRYRDADVNWTQGQRMWLDQLCNEARLVNESQAGAQPCSSRSFSVLHAESRKSGSPEQQGQARPLRTPARRLNHWPR